jgi:hypothetical protein
MVFFMTQIQKIEIDPKLIAITYWKILPWGGLEEILKVTYSSDSLSNEFVRTLLQAVLGMQPAPPTVSNEPEVIEDAIRHHGFYLEVSYDRCILGAIEVGCGFNGDIKEYRKALSLVLLNSLDFEDQITDNEKVPPELEKRLREDTLSFFPRSKKVNR